MTGTKRRVCGVAGLWTVPRLSLVSRRTIDGARARSACVRLCDGGVVGPVAVVATSVPSVVYDLRLPCDPGTEILDCICIVLRIPGFIEPS